MQEIAFIDANVAYSIVMYIVIIKQFINDVINLELFVGFCLFVMVTRKMEQEINELKKNINQQFDA